MNDKELPERLVKRSVKEHFKYLERREEYLERVVNEQAGRRGAVLKSIKTICMAAVTLELKNLYSQLRDLLGRWL